jgi:hypothetical protein
VGAAVFVVFVCVWVYFCCCRTGCCVRDCRGLGLCKVGIVGCSVCVECEGERDSFLRRMYIVQKLDEIFCRHQVGPCDLWCDLVLEFIFCLDVLSIGDRGY